MLFCWLCCHAFAPGLYMHAYVSDSYLSLSLPHATRFTSPTLLGAVMYHFLLVLNTIDGKHSTITRLRFLQGIAISGMSQMSYVVRRSVCISTQPEGLSTTAQLYFGSLSKE